MLSLLCLLFLLIVNKCFVIFVILAIACISGHFSNQMLLPSVENTDIGIIAKLRHFVPRHVFLFGVSVQSSVNLGETLFRMTCELMNNRTG